MTISFFGITTFLLECYFFFPRFSYFLGGSGHLAIIVLSFLGSVHSLKISSKRLKLLICIFLFGLIELFFYAFMAKYNSNLMRNYYISDLLIRYLDIFAVILACFRIKEASETEKIVFFTTFLILTTLTYVDTIINLQINPELVRDLVTTSLSSDVKGSIANYNTVYASLGSLPIIWQWKKTEGYQRLVAISYIILLSVFLISAAFSISIIIYMIEIILLVYYDGETSSSRKKILIYIVLLAVLVCVFLNLQSIILFVANNTKSYSFRDRMMSVYNFLAYKEQGRDFASRMRVYSISLQSIWHYPFIGIMFGFKGAESLEMVSGHSRALDVIAIYGLFSLIYYSWIHKFYKEISFTLDDDFSKKMLQCIKVCFFLVIILNPMYEAYGFVYGAMMLIISDSLIGFRNQTKTNHQGRR